MAAKPDPAQANKSRLSVPEPSTSFSSHHLILLFHFPSLLYIRRRHKLNPGAGVQQTSLANQFKIDRGHKSGSSSSRAKTMAAKKSGSEMAVVRGLDVARYMGRWYEIASFPSFFQPRDGRDTRATYTLQEDGATVHVLNETWSKGKRDYIEGSAYKADPASDEAKLKVKFYLPPFLPIIPVVGDYWVLYVDDDYQYALVGEPRRKNLWILCRKTHMEEEVYNQLVERAKEEGYDVAKLHKTPQDDPPPESDAAPTDSKGTWWFKSLFGK